MFSVENVKALVRMAYLPHARDAFGEPGSEGITTLLDAVKLIFQRCPPEALRGPLTVVVGMSSTPATPAIGVLGPPTAYSSYETLGNAVASAATGMSTWVEVSKDGTFLLIYADATIDPKPIAQDALVYRYDDGVERILAKGHDDYVQKVSPLLKSNFADATLHSLEEAFARYSLFVLETKCRILTSIWEGGVNGPRLVLVNKPESIMRDSLIQALQLVLRDTSVRPEQNTDETMPVDIRVEWFASGASALIEVKWLGKSTAISRKPGPEPTYTVYGPTRAQEGADQLADYMDREVRHSDATSPKGYLVVFDARRKNTKGANDTLTAADAMHFATDVLKFDPDHAKTRLDFAEPVRFFLNPRKSNFRAA